MKKVWLKVLAGGLSLASIFAMTACGNEPQPPKHVHSYSGYVSNADGHWQVCVDGDNTTDKVDHVFADDYDTDCDVCGFVRTVKTKKERIMDFVKSLESIEVATPNTYATSFDDMVKYLAEKKVIADAANGVDINTNGGYLKKYDGTYDDALKVADKAVDYDGVWLFWWDVANGSDTMSNWANLPTSGNTIVVQGGMYTLPVMAYSGYYALSFKEGVEHVRNFSYDWSAEGADYNDYQAKQKDNLKEAIALSADQIATFEAIDNAPNSIACFTKTDEIAIALQKAGYLAVTDLASVDLNQKYSYTSGEQTKYVSIASEAKQYGNISIYYYNTSDGMFSYYAPGKVWESMQEGNTATVYADMDGDWNFDAFTQKDGKYDAEGTVATFTVDMIIGNFAISIAE